MKSVINYTTPKEIGRKAMQGIEFVPIKDAGNSLQVRRKRLQDAEVLPYVHTLFAKAWHDLQELQEVQGLPVLPPAKDFDTLVSFFKTGTSDVIQTPCDMEDRMSRIISLVQEGFAILSYVLGENTLYNEIAGKRENNLLN